MLSDFSPTFPGFYLYYPEPAAAAFQAEGLRGLCAGALARAMMDAYVDLASRRTFMRHLCVGAAFMLAAVGAVFGQDRQRSREIGGRVQADRAGDAVTTLHELPHGD